MNYRSANILTLKSTVEGREQTHAATNQWQQEDPRCPVIGGSEG